MISVFAGLPRLSGFLVTKACLVGALAVFAFGLRAQQDGPNRPRLTHQSQPATQSEDSIGPADDVGPSAKVSGTPIGDGLVLPSVGHVWATDNFDGLRQLVQLKYVPTDIDRHVRSNLLKTNMAPFIYKPKESVEIQGAESSVRLHDPNLNIYLRGYAISYEEDAAASSETSTQMDLALVRVESKKDRRIVSTIAFTQVTNKPARDSQTLAIKTEKVGNTDWQKITANEPLTPGEYALMCMPRGQNLFPTRVFDFAIDPKAPANSNAVMPVKPSSSQ